MGIVVMKETIEAYACTDLFHVVPKIMVVEEDVL